MARDDSRRQSHGSDVPNADPWAAFGYLVSGVAFYGLVGWGLDQWWGTSFMVAVGIVAGAAFGIYLTIMKFRAPQDPGQPDKQD